MLRGIHPAISPDLMACLLSMGHGDEIVLADGNFPAASHARKLIRADGLGVPDLLEAIAPLFPLDQYDENPALVMALTEQDRLKPEPPIWSRFQEILDQSSDPSDPRAGVQLAQIERFQFYERAKEAYAIAATSESAVYANIILKKGVVQP